MFNQNCCFIDARYFIEHPDFIKMLDPGNITKQSQRTYIFIRVDIDDNHFYLPLRNNLGNEIRPYGRIGHAVPSKTRPNAGIDYRYALIVNDDSFIHPHAAQKLPDSQYNRITSDYDAIKAEFSVYLRRYRKVAAKGRISREPLFRESSLINFHAELGISNRNLT